MNSSTWSMAIPFHHQTEWKKVIKLFGYIQKCWYIETNIITAYLHRKIIWRQLLKHLVNSKHYLQNYQDINSPNYSTPNPKLWKNDIIKCFLETLSLFYLSVGNLQTISRLEVYQDLPSRNQTKVTVPSPNLITKLSPLLILPRDCYANRSDIPCDIISSLSFCQYSHHLASEGEKIWMKSNS